jgi:pimeloyl-ACP methyl ester carboxylesterase
MDAIKTSFPLSDGRKLGYAEYGDPQGKPVFFFHGTPGSRFFRPYDEITTGLGVRLICVERPGYGESTFQPARCFLDWPEDIKQLANFLAIEKFWVSGHSGGAPYVSACALALPNRVRGAAILSGAGPLDSPGAARNLTAMNKFGLAVGRFVPWFFWRGLIWIFYHRRAEDPDAEIDRGTGHRPQVDEEQIQKPEVRDICVRSEVEAFRHGLHGVAWDTRLLTRSWGFALEEIRIPVQLWHGTDDDQTSLSMARSVASKIPGSTLTICEKEAHLLLFPHWEEILTQLTSE